MTTKDLNLSFDRGSLRPTGARGPSRQSATASQVRAAVATRLDDSIAPGRAAPQKGSSWHSGAIAGIAVINMLFLVFSGVWLTQRSAEPPSQFATRQAESTTQLTVLQARMEQQIDLLEQKLDNLQQALNSQHHLMVSAFQDIGLRMQEGMAAAETRLDTAATAAVAAIDATKPPKADPHRRWYINLGHFQSEAAALDIQLLLRASGYTTQIQTLEIDHQTAFTVIVPNFEDQSSAESAVSQLLQLTELDGLTVWQEK